MQHRMTLFVVSVLVGLWLWALPAFADGDGVRCQVTTPVLRVRSAPNEAQLGTAYGGTWLTATARNADTSWIQVTWSGRDAWVMAQWLRCDTPLGDLEEASGADAAPVAATTPASARDDTPKGPATPPLVQTMLDAVNQVRAKAGLPPYDLDSRAQDAAQWQANDMITRSYFAHNTPDGRRPADLMRERGLPCPGWCGQNIIMGQTEDEIAYSINWFMNSTVHRANLLHRRYTGIGIGVAEYRPGRHYFILNFFGD